LPRVRVEPRFDTINGKGPSLPTRTEELIVAVAPPKT
jgi:hypothetical protein